MATHERREHDTPEPSAVAGESQASTGGSTEVKVDGSDLAGLDLNSVTCVKQGGKITVASGAVSTWHCLTPRSRY